MWFFVLSAAEHSTSAKDKRIGAVRLIIGLDRPETCHISHNRVISARKETNSKKGPERFTSLRIRRDRQIAVHAIDSAVARRGSDAQRTGTACDIGGEKIQLEEGGRSDRVGPAQ